MGLFRSGKAAEPDPPVRRERVISLLQALMAESDANPDSCEAEVDALDALSKISTPAEYGAAVEAAKRNGY